MSVLSGERAVATRRVASQMHRARSCCVRGGDLSLVVSDRDVTITDRRRRHQAVIERRAERPALHLSEDGGGDELDGEAQQEGGQQLLRVVDERMARVVKVVRAAAAIHAHPSARAETHDGE